MSSNDAAAMTIEQQHDAIMQCCGSLLAALAAGPGDIAVAQVRLRLAGLLQANLASEERELNAPIRRLPTAERPRDFVRLGVEAADLRARYSEHVGRWRPAAIDADWNGYVRAATTLIQQVRDHLAAKQRVLPEWKRAALDQTRGASR